MRAYTIKTARDDAPRQSITETDLCIKAKQKHSGSNKRAVTLPLLFKDIAEIISLLNVRLFLIRHKSVRTKKLDRAIRKLTDSQYVLIVCLTDTLAKQRRRVAAL